jgi:hypothetical protein
MKRIFKNKIVVVSLILIFIAAVVLSLILIFKKGSTDANLNHISKDLNTYNMELKYNNDHSLNGNEKLNFTNRTDAVLNILCFNLYASAFKEGAVNKPVSAINVENAYPNGYSFGGIEILGVKINDKQSTYVLEGVDKNVLKLALDKALYPFDKAVIEINFTVTIPNINHRFGYGVNAINIANFYPILAVYENGEFLCDPYNSNGDPFYSDMSNYNVSLTVPNNLKVAHTGNATKTNNLGENTNYEISALVVRDFAFVLSDKFQIITGTVDETTVKYYFYNDENPSISLKAACDSIRTYNELFGKYPYSTYSVVKTNFVHGGMEYPNLVY